MSTNQHLDTHSFLIMVLAYEKSKKQTCIALSDMEAKFTVCSAIEKIFVKLGNSQGCF